MASIFQLRMRPYKDMLRDDSAMEGEKRRNNESVQGYNIICNLRSAFAFRQLLLSLVISLSELVCEDR